MRLNDLLALSHVPRWSTVRHDRFQSVAEHSYRTLVIFIELCDRLGIRATVPGLLRVMCHDGAEAWTGDIPGNFKRRLLVKFPAFPETEQAALQWRTGLTGVHDGSESSEEYLLRIADKIEAYTFIRSHGQGAHAERVQQRLWASLTDEVKDTAIEQAVRDVIRDIFNEVERD